MKKRVEKGEKKERLEKNKTQEEDMKEQMVR